MFPHFRATFIYFMYLVVLVVYFNVNLLLPGIKAGYVECLYIRALEKCYLIVALKGGDIRWHTGNTFSCDTRMLKNAPTFSYKSQILQFIETIHLAKC